MADVQDALGLGYVRRTPKASPATGSLHGLEQQQFIQEALNL